MIETDVCLIIEVYGGVLLWDVLCFDFELYRFVYFECLDVVLPNLKKAAGLAIGSLWLVWICLDLSGRSVYYSV